MVEFSLIDFIGLASLYFFSVILVFLIPGLAVFHVFKLRFSYPIAFILSLVIGMVLWGIQGYVLGYLQLRFLTYAYTLFCFLILIYKRSILLFYLKKCLSAARSLDRVALGILVVGITIQSLQMIGSGFMTKEGMEFYRVHSQDGIFHLGLISSIVRQFPPNEPGSAGTAVVNYHYWSDLILAEQARVFRIPVHVLFFQFTPILLSFLTGAVQIGLLYKITRDQSEAFKKNVVRFGLFFLYMGSDLAYLFMLFLHQKAGFYTSAIDNGATQFLNMPHAMAKLVYLVLFLLLLRWIGRKEWKTGVLIGILTGVLFGIKVYFGLLFAAGLAFLFAAYLFLFIKQHWEKKAVIHWVSLRKSFLFQMLLIGGLAILILLAVYLPPNRGAGGLGYYPLEWPKLLLSEENLDWKELRYRKAIVEYYKNTPKIILYDAIAILTTLLCIHGTRLLGLIPSWKLSQIIGKKVYFGLIIAPTLIFTFLGLYTLQKSGSFNVFNFFASSLTLLSMTSAILLTLMWQSKQIFLRAFVILILVLTMPRIVYETGKIITSYQQHTDRVLIPTEEIEALSYIKNTSEKNAIIQSHYANTLDMNTPYTSYFANRFNYIAGQKVLDTHAQETKPRYEEARQLFGSHNPAEYREAFRRWNISYLYLRTQDTLPFDPSLANLTLVYENTKAKVYAFK